MHHKDCKHEPWTPSEAADRTHPFHLHMAEEKHHPQKQPSSAMLLVALVVASHFVQVEGQLEDYGPETVDPHQKIQKSHLHLLLDPSHFAQEEGQLASSLPESVYHDQIQKSHLHPLLDQHLTVVRQVTQVASILGHGF